jgi:hypothetical protein
MKQIHLQQQVLKPVAAKSGQQMGVVYKRSLRQYYPDQVLAPAAPGAKGIISACSLRHPLFDTAKIAVNLLMC